VVELSTQALNIKGLNQATGKGREKNYKKFYKEVDAPISCTPAAQWYNAQLKLLRSRVCIIKLITAVIYGFRNKLECLSLASLSSLV
jgi:hypothetical protein